MSNLDTTPFRIFAALVMITLILWGYWWIMWICAVVFLFLFPVYYEILLWGIVYDALYGLPLPQFWNFPYVFTTGTTILFLASIFVRKYLLAYESTI